ncbi:5055_t:CDS:2 [Funneliformis mosseae]|uniref:5055_t:CDS:1 n=1 Tax=Funneliformis mosseae TaxID=27381 RepID=A0A9N9HX09_FUNMO|nr:5055_t:CDS:2 [Funneliformis mosseae]
MDVRKLLRNKEEAMEWYLKFANYGNADAQFRVGKFFTSNNNDQKAFGWKETWYARTAQGGMLGTTLI